MKNPYEILNLTEDSTREELEARYNELKAKYSEDRFLSGAEGAEAARKLTELEDAWREIQSKIEIKEVNAESVNDYGYIDKLIKEGRYDDAQAALDEISEREGEWHYYQSMVYYKREWLTECKKHLELAISCDPYNNKYKVALDKLLIVMGNPNANPQNLGKDTINNGQPQQPFQEQPGGDALSNCCMAYMCSSMCCNCSRCCM